MSDLKFVQADIIDKIDFHLSMSNATTSHPDYLKALSIASHNFIKGQCLFIGKDLQNQMDGISKRNMEIMFMTVGESVLRYLIGDTAVEQFIKAVEEG